MTGADSGRVACALCGDTEAKTTIEHVFGDWMAEEFPEQKRLRHRGHERVEPHSGKRITKEWTEQDFRHQTRVRVLCDRCNNEWGSQLESAAEPIVTAMIRGGFRLYKREEATTVATWATKAAILWQYVDPPDLHLIPFEYRRSLRDRNEPPPNTVVVAGSQRPGGMWNHGTSLQMLHVGERGGASLQPGATKKPARNPPDGFMSVLGFGQLFLIICGVFDDGTRPPSDPSEIAPDAVVRLWPDPADLIIWPTWEDANDLFLQTIGRNRSGSRIFFPGPHENGASRNRTKTPNRSGRRRARKAGSS